MADIVTSLFGLSPQDTQQQINQEDVANALAIAQLPQGKRAAYTGQLIGAKLSRGLLGAFGVQDPRLQRATSIEEALKEVNDSLTEEEKANPALLYGRLADTLSAKGLTQESTMARAKAQELGLQYEQKQAIIQEKTAAAKEKERITKQEEDFRTALQALPMDATDEDYYKVASKFGTSKDILASIDKRTLAREARQAKAEDLQTRLEGDLQRSRERNDTLLQQARMQGANAAQIKAIEQQGRIDLENLQHKHEVALESIKASNKALNAGVPKDVAEASSQITGLDYTSKKINDWKSKLDSGQIIFSPKENAIATASLASGFPTENALNQNEVKRMIREGVNVILQQAKGTQTDGDAHRAEALFLEASSSNSTKAWQAAMNALLDAQTKLKAEKQNYIKVRGFADKVGGTSNNDPLGIRINNGH